MNTRAHTRRSFLAHSGAVLASGCCAASNLVAFAQADKPRETYESQAKGLRILPGAWRPHYPWEHIAWISPSWPSQDYIWLDFPEAVFTDRGLIYLSHINPAAPAVYESWPRVEWESREGEIRFERTLPDGVAFGGRVFAETTNVAGLSLRIKNGSTQPLKNITLQTCAFLRAIKEFADYTADNKFVHVPRQGWITYRQAQEMSEDKGKFGVGWRTRGNRKADVPMMATVSNKGDRLVAMTWLSDTLSMVQNAGHPCMHADPYFKDLEPGAEQAIHGRLIFFEGPLAEFDFESYLK